MSLYDKRIARDAVIASLTSPTTFNSPGVSPDTPRGLHGRELSNAIKRTASEAFPGTAFRVRGSRGTGAGYFSLGWTDGPSVHEVNVVVARFIYERFEALTDSCEGTGRPAYFDQGEWLEPSARGISTSRKLSESLVTSMVDAYCARYTSANRPSGSFHRGDWMTQYPWPNTSTAWNEIVYQLSTGDRSLIGEG